VLVQVARAKNAFSQQWAGLAGFVRVKNHNSKKDMPIGTINAPTSIRMLYLA
jgi:hypothetical protein